MAKTNLYNGDQSDTRYYFWRCQKEKGFME